LHLQQTTQSELSRLIGIEQPTMAITLRRMERDGIIERSPDPKHGRKSLVKLTARGRRLRDVIAAAAHDVQKVASKGLTTAELEEFYRFVDLMTENLRAERRG
jgi:MarR family transcriptional regulator for hemolysin